MFRSWAQDNSYLTSVNNYRFTPHLVMNITYSDATPTYTAPVRVYTSSRKMGREPSENMKTNLTWVFPVHAGFMYVMRLHFCEILQEVVKMNDRVFSIYINRELTWESMDVFSEAGGRGIPIYRDFAIFISDTDKQRMLVDLWLELHPYIKYEPIFYDAILNGLEIFKVSDAHGSLAGANPDMLSEPPVPKPEPAQNKSDGTSVGVIAWCVVGGGALFFLLNPSSKQGLHEFQTEIEMLSKLRHVHLVR